MNSREAKEILSLYRPGSADAQDTAFTEALEVIRTEPDLARWFEIHCANYESIRARLKQIVVPGGLKEQILAEQKTQIIPMPLWWRRPSQAFRSSVTRLEPRRASTAPPEALRLLRS